jgi:zinc transport system substrate-binding protein
VMRYIISSILSMLPLPALADVPRVITDIPPVYGLVAQVMGDLGAPVLLLEKGADEHDFQLRPSQMRDIASADVAVWIGPELTPWMERALEGAKGDMASLPLLAVQGTALLEFRAADDHGDDHDHGHDHDHNRSGTDPHAWLNPENTAPWLDAIAAALSAKDSVNAATYAANAAAAKAEIAALDAEISAALSPVKDKGFVAYHDAYQYFVAHYGLNYQGALAMGDASAAGAAHLREVQSKIADGVVCVFPEVQHDADLLLQLTEGTAVKAGAALDPAGAMLNPSPASFTDVLRNLTAALTGCLSGA